MFAEWNAHDLDAVYGRLTDDYQEYLNGALAKTSRAEARAWTSRCTRRCRTTPEQARSCGVWETEWLPGLLSEGG